MTNTQNDLHVAIIAHQLSIQLAAKLCEFSKDKDRWDMCSAMQNIQPLLKARMDELKLELESVLFSDSTA